MKIKNGLRQTDTTLIIIRDSLGTCHRCADSRWISPSRKIFRRLGCANALRQAMRVQDSVTLWQPNLD
ncbi:MAG: hypothetical protein DME54_11275 [Verrucomicrobia bacterium]|nr:MAG: hypothetical protein DME54_11275 [Verrucomicrobiota bacterium]PYL20320.1 MAG: hypothetical protein DMF41_06590 [Verrucomicrobiota bacterium]